jgi:thioredoxin-like negative regulator of GroEL
MQLGTNIGIKQNKRRKEMYDVLQMIKKDARHQTIDARKKLYNLCWMN